MSLSVFNTIVSTLTEFGRTFGALLLSDLKSAIDLLEEAIPIFDFSVPLGVISALAPDFYSWLLDTPFLVVFFGAGLLAYVVFTMVKYIVDLVL